MASSSLLLLIDDIAALLDDVAVMSKIAAKKTAGVLGDDLALNAQQVTGIQADRELPVVWAVAKGSFFNKLLLVPAALTISIVAPMLITPLLIIGGLFLCYEGVEKILHKLLHSDENQQHHDERIAAINNKDIDMVAFEKEKIKGAIRTDFILSAEIIAITLGVVANEPFVTKAGVLSVVAVMITIIVYGLVAAIVRLDDWGLYLHQKNGEGFFQTLQQKLGYSLIQIVPWLMKGLSIFGTAAMFLVGGGILTHGIPLLHHWLEPIVHHSTLISMMANGVCGIVAGLIVFIFIDNIAKPLTRKYKH